MAPTPTHVAAKPNKNTNEISPLPSHYSWHCHFRIYILYNGGVRTADSIRLWNAIGFAAVWNRRGNRSCR